MDTTLAADPQLIGIGLLVGRVVLGLLMAAHGTQKLFGWFGGYGLKATGEFFVHMGFRNGPLFAGAASAAEVVSGLLVAFGLLGPVGPAMMISIMIVAAVSVHAANGLWASKNGIELPLLYGAGAFVLALAGSGIYSLDAVFGLTERYTPALTWIALAVGVTGGVLNLLLRRQRPAATA